jgi:prepilin-type N-terminal cleavage/methylation domain-containing protein
VRNGFTLGEMIVVIAVMAVVAALIGPRLGPAFDRIATDGAARDVTTALAVARAAAVMQGTRARLRIAPESLRVDRAAPGGWQRYARWPGPAAVRGLSVSTRRSFWPPGDWLGAANAGGTRRGSQIVPPSPRRGWDG